MIAAGKPGIAEAALKPKRACGPKAANLSPLFSSWALCTFS
jgi:hypothetical protein